MTTPAAIPQDRVQVFNRAGKKLDEFSCSASRSWTIGNDEGLCSMMVPNKSAFVNDTVVRPGNWVWVSNSSLPDDWVGIIDLPVVWGSRVVNINAFSPLRLIEQARGGRRNQKIKGSAGELFRQIITVLNAECNTVIRVGNIFSSNQRQETLTPAPLLQSLIRIQERSNEEYTFRPVLEGGRLRIYADWKQKLGRKVNFTLLEGDGGGNIELSSNILVQDVPLINDVYAYGAGETWKSRPKIFLQDQSSIARYGVRQISVSYDTVIERGTLREHAQSLLDLYSEPSRRYELYALNVGDTFSFLSLGNRLRLKMQNVAFGVDTNVRILGMNYNPNDGYKMLLVLQEF